MASKKNTAAPTFEQCADRLDSIVARMEQPDTGLEEMITLVEEGLGLIRNSRKMLAEAELKIRTLEEQPAPAPAAPQPEDDGFSLL